MNYYQKPFIFIGSCFIVGLVFPSCIKTCSSFIFITCFVFCIFDVLFFNFKKAFPFYGLLFVLLGSESQVEYSGAELNASDAIILEIREIKIGKHLWNRSICKVHRYREEGRWHKDQQQILLLHKGILKRGDLILLAASCSKIKNKNNPGEFDQEAYWNAKGIHYICFAPKKLYHVLKEGSGESSFLRRFRDDLAGQISENFEINQAGILGALLLGDKTHLSADVKQRFSNAGVMHLLAVSGLHIGILSFLLFSIMRRFSRVLSKSVAIVICILILWIYAFFTGSSPSVLRACFMFSLLMIAKLKGLNGKSLNLLFFSAFILLLLNPRLIYDLSFQLSYLAMLGIFLSFDKIHTQIYFSNKYLAKVWSGIALGISAQVFTFPIILYHFHQFPNYFILSNVLVMLFAGMLMSFGLFYLSFAFVPLLNWILIAVLSILLTMLVRSVFFVEQMPWSTAVGFELSAQHTLFLLGMVFLIFWGAYKWVKFVGCIGLLIGMFFVQFIRYDNLNKSELVVFNQNYTLISFKRGNQILSFVDNKKNTKKARSELNSYYKVAPGHIRLKVLKNGETVIKMKDFWLRIKRQKKVVEIRCPKNRVFVYKQRGRYKIYYGTYSKALSKKELSQGAFRLEVP